MKPIKVSELTGAALDWVVAKCEGIVYDNPAWTSYSTDWAQGGPIIEREGIGTFKEGERRWVAHTYGAVIEHYGKTALIAAMRCYVASKLGDTVEIPEELL